MLSSNEVNILGNIFNSSWGRSGKGTYDCKATFQGNKIKIMYSTTAYFASERDMHFQQTRISEESLARIADLIKLSKDQFKEMSGSALKLDEVSNRDSLELVNASMNNPRRIFLYRRFAEFEILNGSEQ
tara:strand:+ start:3871 stop:4257 length:387 start_codon:yes stop_codon:yes gene_type:complete